MRIYLLLFVGIGLCFQSCVNHDLDKIELRAGIASHFTIAGPITDSSFAQEVAVIDIDNFQYKIDLANLNTNEIDKVTADAVVLQLNTPSDSTFAFFKSMTLSLKNNTDSIAFAEIGDFTVLTGKQATLRTLDNDVKAMLIDNNYWMEMAYTTQIDTLPDGIDIDLIVEWLIEGEVK